MSGKRSRGCLVAAILWCVLLGVLAVAYKFLVAPFLDRELEQETGSQSRYRSEIRLAADSFSGYAILRSPELQKRLQREGVRLVVEDDRADYDKRLQGLRSGELDLAAFTVDSWISAGARAGEFPGSIVMVLDETVGGDAIVGRPEDLPDLQSLDHPEARLVVVPGSPSEFLARVVLANFSLPSLPEEWSIAAESGADALRQARDLRGGRRHAFVLWEPHVTRAVQDHGYHVLLDSSRIQGYIVDVLVARRSFLRDDPGLVASFLRAYLGAAWEYHSSEGGMVRLVADDSGRAAGQRLSEELSAKVVQGIRWKNTLENYAHFGLEEAGQGQQHIEDILINIVDVLVRTGAIREDPLEGRYHTLFYREILEQLRDEGFHPAGEDPDRGAVRTVQSAGALSEGMWSRLRPVGELKIEPIAFVRGSGSISPFSRRHLSEAARKLKTFPHFYLRIIGQTRAEGDREANRVLAQERARAAAGFLIGEGVPEERIRTEAQPSGDRSGAAQSVRFVVGQLPY